MFKADYHVHSSFSGDSAESLDRIFRHGYDLGLMEVAITDHLDPDFPNDRVEFDIDLGNYCKTIEQHRKNWEGRLNILTGLELGLQQHLAGTLDHIFSDPELDFIIGSIHCAARGDFFDETYFDERSKEESHSIYFQTIYDNLKLFEGISVLGHMDFIKRYGKKHYGTIHSKLDYSIHMDIIDEILKLALEKGIGLEVNTSGYRYGLDHTHPHSIILSRYRELGGDIITMGSDAHRAEDIAAGFDMTKDLLENLGFRYICGFKKKEPLYYPLSELRIYTAEDK